MLGVVHCAAGATMTSSSMLVPLLCTILACTCITLSKNLNVVKIGWNEKLASLTLYFYKFACSRIMSDPHPSCDVEGEYWTVTVKKPINSTHQILALGRAQKRCLCSLSQFSSCCLCTCPRIHTYSHVSSGLRTAYALHIVLTDTKLYVGQFCEPLQGSLDLVSRLTYCKAWLALSQTSREQEEEIYRISV